ncbi:MAG: hypothetical protein LBF57_04050 [Holosporaceae bacterium]|jgi:hypothetical protein|nr:hypothetical protein [Holosporaceae bacterium]
MSQGKKQTFAIIFSRQCKLFFVVYFIALSIIPLVTRNVISYDMIENIHWEKELQLGYRKYPSLFAWTSYFFYKDIKKLKRSL